MKRLVGFFLIAAVIVAAVELPLQPPEAKMTAKVVDEAGKPVPGARVQIFF